MNRTSHLISSFFLFCALLFCGSSAFAETDPNVAVGNGLNNREVSRTGLLVLQFSSTGMTEAAARSYSILLAQNLANTKRFVVTDVEASEQVVMNEAPSLLPCFEIGCGTQMAQIMGAERVLSGHITLMEDGQIRLTVKLVNVTDNSLEFQDFIRFSDELRDQRFYQLAMGIAKNTPLKGVVLEANNKIAVISLGGDNGVKVGDRLVIYRNLTIKGDVVNGLMQDNTRRNNIGLLTITKVGNRSSEGVYFQTIETPKAGQFVATFLDRSKQIGLISAVRRELDTHLRNVFEIEEKVVIDPVTIIDVDKNKWIAKIRFLEAHQDFWQTWIMGSGAATVLVMATYSSGDDFKAIAAIGALAYSTFEYFRVKNEIKGLVEEGKFKGYLDIKIDPVKSEASAGIKFLF